MNDAKYKDIFCGNIKSIPLKLCSYWTHWLSTLSRFPIWALGLASPIPVIDSNLTLPAGSMIIDFRFAFSFARSKLKLLWVKFLFFLIVLVVGLRLWTKTMIFNYVNAYIDQYSYVGQRHFDLQIYLEVCVRICCKISITFYKNLPLLSIQNTFYLLLSPEYKLSMRIFISSTSYCFKICGSLVMNLTLLCFAFIIGISILADVPVLDMFLIYFVDVLIVQFAWPSGGKISALISLFKVWFSSITSSSKIIRSKYLQLIGLPPFDELYLVQE